MPTAEAHVLRARARVRSHTSVPMLLGSPGMETHPAVALDELKREAARKRAESLRGVAYICLVCIAAPAVPKALPLFTRHEAYDFGALLVAVPAVIGVVTLAWSNHIERRRGTRQ